MKTTRLFAGLLSTLSLVAALAQGAAPAAPSPEVSVYLNPD